MTQNLFIVGIIFLIGGIFLTGIIFLFQEVQQDYKIECHNNYDDKICGDLGQYYFKFFGLFFLGILAIITMVFSLYVLFLNLKGILI